MMTFDFNFDGLAIFPVTFFKFSNNEYIMLDAKPHRMLIQISLSRMVWYYYEYVCDIMIWNFEIQAMISIGFDYMCIFL